VTQRGISATAAKTVYRLLVESYRATGQCPDVYDIVESNDLWLSDEWTHVGHVVLTCLGNQKLIEQYHKGNVKTLDVLLGKTLKAANMTLDAGLVRDLVPLVIERHWPLAPMSSGVAP